MNPDYELILSKLDGMDQRNDARFEGLRREQDNVHSWLERLTVAVEKTFSLEERMGASEKTQAEFKAELAAHRADIQTIKTNAAVSSWRLGAIVSSSTLAIGAALAALAEKLIK